MKVTIGNATVYIGDALTCLQSMESESVQCCVTSPPYFGLRNYKVDGQIGLERTVGEYIDRLVQVFRELRRVLRKDGTFWLVIGDSYAGSWGNYSPNTAAPKEGWSKSRFSRKAYDDRTWRPANSIPQKGLKTKDLCGIPWKIALALQADGWWLRSDTIEKQIWICPCCGKEMELIRQNCDRDIIWEKPNCNPESTKDRPTKSHEYIFLLSKNKRYFYDYKAIQEKSITKDARAPYGSLGTWELDGRPPEKRNSGKPKKSSSELRHKRSVWTVPVISYKDAHFATYPPALIEPCILAGSKPGDIILDPFFGSGTTGEVALKYGRKVVGIELNPGYRLLWEKRVKVAQRQTRLYG